MVPTAPPVLPKARAANVRWTPLRHCPRVAMVNVSSARPDWALCSWEAVDRVSAALAVAIHDRARASALVRARSPRSAVRCWADWLSVTVAAASAARARRRRPWIEASSTATVPRTTTRRTTRATAAHRPLDRGAVGPPPPGRPNAGCSSTPSSEATVLPTGRPRHGGAVLVDGVERGDRPGDLADGQLVEGLDDAAQAGVELFDGHRREEHPLVGVGEGAPRLGELGRDLLERRPGCLVAALRRGDRRLDRVQLADHGPLLTDGLSEGRRGPGQRRPGADVVAPHHKRGGQDRRADEDDG